MSEEKENINDFLALWIQGQLSDDDLKKQTDKDAATDFSKILASADKLAFPPYDVEAELHRLQQQKATQPKAKSIQFPILKYAVAAILIIGIALVYYLTLPNYEIFSTQPGEMLLVELPDGSTINLGGNSEVKYIASKYEESRNIQLEGEAFFDVVKGVNFEVKTDEGIIQVLGTTFNVNHRRSTLDVICYSGKVNVSNESSNQDLLPGEAVRLEAGKQTKSWKVENAQKPSWMSGVTEIHDADLQVAVDALQSIFNITIESSIDLQHIPFDGAFPHSDVTIALKSVLGAGDVNYAYQEEQKLVKISAKK